MSLLLLIANDIAQSFVWAILRVVPMISKLMEWKEPLRDINPKKSKNLKPTCLEL
jgi:hypothetical protein